MSLTAKRGEYRIIEQVEKRDVSSHSRTYSVTFSPSSSRSRLNIIDSGQRYEIRLKKGIVEFSRDGISWRELTPPQLPVRVPLPWGISYQNLRAGEPLARVLFDMVVASRGRLLAKEKGTDRVFHLILDELFRTLEVSTGKDNVIPAVPSLEWFPARDQPVPSSYLKLDPEFFTPGEGFDVPNQFQWNYSGHPASLRFKVFSELMQAESSDMMCVLVAPRVWYLLDTRSPLMIFDIEDLKCVGDEELKQAATLQNIQEVVRTFYRLQEAEIVAAVKQWLIGLIMGMVPDLSTPISLSKFRSDMIGILMVVQSSAHSIGVTQNLANAVLGHLDHINRNLDTGLDVASTFDPQLITRGIVTDAVNLIVDSIEALESILVEDLFVGFAAHYAREQIEDQGFAALFFPGLIGLGMVASKLKDEGVVQITQPSAADGSCSQRSGLSFHIDKAVSFLKEQDNRALRRIVDDLIRFAREKRKVVIPNAPPAGIATYQHVVYDLASQNPPSPFGSSSVVTPAPAVRPTVVMAPAHDLQPRDAIDFTKVLDLGVGTSHWAEHWVTSFGGEIHSLLHRRPIFQQEQFSLALYHFLNGPVEDGDCFVDGTTNFYMLVKLADPPEDLPEEVKPLNRSYAILWVDEQTYFTQRWRLLHPTLDTAGDAVSLARQLRYNPEYFRFDINCFWDPFENDCIDDNTRMAVSRQIIVLSGRLPENRASPLTSSPRPEIYTICFAFGLCDYTWRWRNYPYATNPFTTDYAYLDQDIAGGNDRLQTPRRECVYLNTLGIREDATLHVRGFKRSLDGRGLTEGRWFQKYLPVDGRYVPQKHDLIPGKKPAQGFDHPWHFVSEDAYRNADRFYQFGVYQEKIDARCQYYEIEFINDTSNRPPATIDETVVWRNQWISDAGDSPLRVDTINFKWTLPQDNAGYIHLKDLTLDRSQARSMSMYELTTRFRLLDRGPKGVIAVFSDKRDDDLQAASHLPHVTEFVSDSSDLPRARFRALVRRNRRVVRPPVVQKVLISLGRPNSDGTTHNVKISFWTSLSIEEAYESLWTISLAALDTGNGEVIQLFSKRIFDNFVREAIPTAPLPLNFKLDDLLKPEFEYSYLWENLTPELVASIDSLCTPRGRVSNATSVWFEDIVGHMATPDELEFGVH